MRKQLPNKILKSMFNLLTNSKKSLSKHTMKIHEQDPYFYCQECHYRTMRKHFLVQHINMEQFVCPN